MLIKEENVECCDIDMENVENCGQFNHANLEINNL